MSEEEDNSFLLVGMDDETQGRISIINRESSSITNYTYHNKIEKKEIKKITKEKLKSCFDKLINKLLSLDRAEKKNKKEKYTEEDFFTFDNIPQTTVEFSRHPSNSFSNENSGDNFDTSLVNHKKKTIIKGVLDLKKENEWNEFIKEYKKEHKEQNKIKKLIKGTFNINSDFILIWKFIYSLFYMIIFFFAFLQFIFFDLIYLDKNEFPKERILYLYQIINYMFLLDLVLSILILITNGGSKFSYLKIPIKIYLVIPFPLEKKYILYLLPKFCRIDLFRKIFQKIEEFIVKHITPFIQNYQLKIFILYINRQFAYLLEFGLYAHFACCLYSYLDDVNYINSIFYTVEIITTIGYGEHSPKNIYSMVLVMITIFIGSNLVILTNCNINFLTTKIHSFSRATSPRKQLEFFVFRIQASTGKLFPKKLKESLVSFFKFYQGISYDNIKSEYISIFSLFRPKVKENILLESLNFLRIEYQLFFTNCENNFVNFLLSKLKPRIYKENKIIINIGKRVKQLHFLLNGFLFACDINNKHIFDIKNNSIFCDYEFITGFKSEYTIRNHPGIISYGFVIKKKDWDIITKKNIYSTKMFIKLCLKRRNNFMKKINEIYENNIDIKNVVNNKEIDKGILDEIFTYQRKVINVEKIFLKFKEDLFKCLKNK